MSQSVSLQLCYQCHLNKLALIQHIRGMKQSGQTLGQIQLEVQESGELSAFTAFLYKGVFISFAY